MKFKARLIPQYIRVLILIPFILLGMVAAMISVAYRVGFNSMERNMEDSGW
jgi:multisubunit Na+/H+ antiporter MnhE subunit